MFCRQLYLISHMDSKEIAYITLEQNWDYYDVPTCLLQALVMQSLCDSKEFAYFGTKIETTAKFQSVFYIPWSRNIWPRPGHHWPWATSFTIDKPYSNIYLTWYRCYAHQRHKNRSICNSNTISHTYYLPVHFCIVCKILKYMSFYNGMQ